MGASEQGASATMGRWLVMPRTLAFVFHGDDVLLMKRAPHKRVFPNRYNGVGGHLERDEDPLLGVTREIAEETGLSVRDLRLRAVSMIDAGESTGILLFVFTAWSDSRMVTENEEGTLHWIGRDHLATLDLVEDLPILLPRLFAMPQEASPLFIHVSYDDKDVIQMRFAKDSS